MIETAKGRTKDIEQCLAIARSLPLYFTSKALNAIRKDLAQYSFWAARDESGNIMGFASVTKSTKLVAELRWIAIAGDYHRQGIGTVLVQTVCTDLKSKGIRLLLARTLSEKSRYSPYKASRKFLDGNDFIHIETLDPYPAWEPGNPCATYIRVL